MFFGLCFVETNFLGVLKAGDSENKKQADCL